LDINVTFSINLHGSGLFLKLKKYGFVLQVPAG